MSSEIEIAKLRELAEKGNVDAQYELGARLYAGGDIRPDYAEGFKWYSAAAAQGHAGAQAKAGHALRHGSGVDMDYKGAFTWYAKAAAQGNTDAMNGLAELYNLGLGVPQDWTEYVNWSTEAAKNGSYGARLAMLQLYHVGSIVLDNAEAAGWYFEIEEEINTANSKTGNHYWYKDNDTLPSIRRDSFAKERPAYEARKRQRGKTE